MCYHRGGGGGGLQSCLIMNLHKSDNPHLPQISNIDYRYVSYILC